MSTERRQRASVGQSLAINRLLGSIIVSSCDAEEPGGLGETEEGSGEQHHLSARFLQRPPRRRPLHFVSTAAQFHLHPRLVGETSELLGKLTI